MKDAIEPRDLVDLTATHAVRGAVLGGISGAAWATWTGALAPVAGGISGLIGGALGGVLWATILRLSRLWRA